MKVTDLPVMTYVLELPPEWRTPLSDYYMKRVSEGGGKAYALSDGGSICSYAILLREERGMVLCYVYTAEELRRRRYASKLIREVISRTKGYVCANISREHSVFPAVSGLLSGLGFQISDVRDTYTVAIDGTSWERMDRLGFIKMKDFLLRDGSRCIPFAEMEPSIREQLLHSRDNAFGNALDPAPFLKQDAAKTDNQLSTVLVSGGELRGYTLVTRIAEDTVCFDQIAEAEAEIGNGSILAPLCSSLEGIRSESAITKIMMTISRKNNRSFNFVNGLVKGIGIQKKENDTFLYRHR